MTSQTHSYNMHILQGQISLALKKVEKIGNPLPQNIRVPHDAQVKER